MPLPEPQLNLLTLLATLFVALTIGTVIRLAAYGRSQDELAVKRRKSLLVWWLLTVVVSLSVVLGRVGVAGLLCGLALLGLVEFRSLLLARFSLSRWPVVVLAGVGIAYFGMIAVGYGEAVRAAFPIVVLLAAGWCGLNLSDLRSYVFTVGATVYIALVLFYALSHAVLLMDLPQAKAAPAGAAGVFLYLVLLTETSDIMQALMGRMFGRRAITKRVSPRKTWEGFLGGLLGTVLLSVATAPWTLPGSWSDLAGPAAALGAVVVLAGFLGDLNISGIKRAVDARDSGQLLPGMGGVLDRIDSLTFAAPVFYFGLQWWVEG